MLDGIVALLACGMTRLSVGGHVEDHQSLFSDGRLHLRGLSHDAQCDGWQLGEYALDAVLARDLLLTGGEEDEVVGLLLPCEPAKGLEEADEASPGVIASEAVELPVDFRRGEGLLLPSTDGLDCLDV